MALQPPLPIRDNPTMQILLNGNAHDLPERTTLQQLLQDHGYAGRRVAVEINREIVPRSQHASTELQPADQVEIVHAMGGG
ncbi:sulfur carrier protein ThiS [Tahibacter aquaticus]|uniref:Sulfur carrier protein ThiS n=2 Tax=Tahibacter aquaticus TaxID=520092 RepID=A0A4R6Z4K0_9GAMM|nr:sulfur carrier protein ThiS [Tahibacter aquaticus]